jgi:site-specific recombinase XerD
LKPGILSKLDNIYKDVERILHSTHYSPHTIRAYLGQLKAFLETVSPKLPSELSVKEIKTYIAYLNKSGRSRSTVDQAVNALNFLYTEVIHRSVLIRDINRPAIRKAPPVILSGNEISRIASATRDMKHKLMILLTYTAGLRTSEVVNLLVGDLNLENLTINVRGTGKRRNRKTILAEILRSPIQFLIESRKPSCYVFTGSEGNPLTTRAVTKFFKAALVASGINKKATPRTLRHSFTAHLLESGADLKIAQKLLGHTRSDITSYYGGLWNLTDLNPEIELDSNN